MHLTLHTQQLVWWASATVLVAMATSKCAVVALVVQQPQLRPHKSVIMGIVQQFQSRAVCGASPSALNASTPNALIVGDSISLGFGSSAIDTAFGCVCPLFVWLLLRRSFQVGIRQCMHPSEILTSPLHCAAGSTCPLLRLEITTAMLCVVCATWHAKHASVCVHVHTHTHTHTHTREHTFR